MGGEEKEEMGINLLRRLLHEEKHSGNKLVSLPDDLVQRASIYITTLNARLAKNMELETLKAKESFKSAFHELITHRMRKVLTRASYADLGTDTSDMKGGDLSFYEIVLTHLDAQRRRMDDLLEGRVQMHKDKKVRILKDIPQYIGSDKKTYGPFKKDDVLELPDEELGWLVKNNFAESAE